MSHLEKTFCFRTSLFFSFQCCFTSPETVLSIKDGEPRTSTSTLSQLLCSGKRVQCPMLLYAQRDRTDYYGRGVQCCFTSTETVGLLGTGAQDGHLDFHTAPVLWEHRTLESSSNTPQISPFFCSSFSFFSSPPPSSSSSSFFFLFFFPTNSSQEMLSVSGLNNRETSLNTSETSQFFSPPPTPSPCSFSSSSSSYCSSSSSFLFFQTNVSQKRLSVSGLNNHVFLYSPQTSPFFYHHHHPLSSSSSSSSHLLLLLLDDNNEDEDDEDNENTFRLHALPPSLPFLPPL